MGTDDARKGHGTDEIYTLTEPMNRIILPR